MYRVPHHPGFEQPLPLLEPDQVSQASSNGSIEPQEEGVYETPDNLTLTSIPLTVDDLGSHIQKLQREEDGFKEEFDVRSLFYTQFV